MSRSLLQKLKPYYVRKAFRYLRHYGPKDFLIRVRERMTPDEVPYGPWYEVHKTSESTLEEERRIFREEYEKTPDGPLFSILVPAYRTPDRFLKELLACVRNQVFGDYELCIANASPEEEKMRLMLEEAAEALSAGKTECASMPHAETLHIMEVMDEIRRQLGVVYPFD